MARRNKSLLFMLLGLAWGLPAAGHAGTVYLYQLPDGSRLITSVEKTREPFMPPKVFPALTEDRIQAIRAWIAQGAKNN